MWTFGFMECLKKVFLIQSKTWQWMSRLSLTNKTRILIWEEEFISVAILWHHSQQSDIGQFWKRFFFSGRLFTSEENVRNTCLRWNVHSGTAIYTQATLVPTGYGRWMGRNTKLEELPGSITLYNIHTTISIKSEHLLVKLLVVQIEFRWPLPHTCALFPLHSIEHSASLEAPWEPKSLSQKHWYANWSPAYVNPKIENWYYEWQNRIASLLGLILNWSLAVIHKHFEIQFWNTIEQTIALLSKSLKSKKNSYRVSHQYFQLLLWKQSHAQATLKPC